MKRLVLALSIGFVLSIVSVGDPGDGARSGWTGFRLELNEADARGGRGGGARGGGRPSRSARSSMRRPSSRPQSRPARAASAPRGNVDRNVNRNVDRDVDRNVNRNVNRNVDIDVDRRYGGAVVAGALVAGAVIASLPPECNAIFIDGVRYYDCGSEYYVESFDGGEVVYQSVPAPN